MSAPNNVSVVENEAETPPVTLETAGAWVAIDQVDIADAVAETEVLGDYGAGRFLFVGSLEVTDDALVGAFTLSLLFTDRAGAQTRILVNALSAAALGSAPFTTFVNLASGTIRWKLDKIGLPVGVKLAVLGYLVPLP